jgi:hypothetical protein
MLLRVGSEPSLELAHHRARSARRPLTFNQTSFHERDDEAEVKEKALAEHVARHPEDVGRTVEDFNWILHEIVRSFIPQR